jgi:hypothetical protein
LAGEIADDDEADEHDADDDDDDTHTKEMSKKKSKKSHAGSKVHLHCKLRSVSCVPGRRMRQPMSVWLLLLLPRPCFVGRDRGSDPNHRGIWSPPMTVCVCLLLQDLLQSCSRGKKII